METLFHSSQKQHLRAVSEKNEIRSETKNVFSTLFEKKNYIKIMDNIIHSNSFFIIETKSLLSLLLGLILRSFCCRGGLIKKA